MVIMTHEGLGVALGVLLELLLGVVLERTGGRREESTGGNTGGHCVGFGLDGVVVVVGGTKISSTAAEVGAFETSVVQFSYDLNEWRVIGQCGPAL